MTIFKKLTFIFFLIMGQSALASDTQLENESTVFNETFSWEAMLGVSAFYNPQLIDDAKQSTVSDWLNVQLFFDLYYKGFFIQSNHMRSDTLLYGAEMGYQLYVDEKWQLDVISKTYRSWYEMETTIFNPENQVIEQFTVTKDAGQGLGLRASHYFDDSVISVDIANLGIISGAKGWVFDWYYNKLFHYRNWDIYLGTGFTVYSEDVNQYYLEPDHRFEKYSGSNYQAQWSYKAQIEALVQYPINKKWLFNAGINYNYYSQGFSESPLVSKSHITGLQLGVVYVF